MIPGGIALDTVSVGGRPLQTLYLPISVTCLHRVAEEGQVGGVAGDLAVALDDARRALLDRVHHLTASIVHFGRLNEKAWTTNLLVLPRMLGCK